MTDDVKPIEPAPVEPEPTTTPAPVEPDQPIEAATESIKPAEPVEPEPVEPVVTEIIREAEQPLSASAKDEIFHDKLDELRPQAVKARQAKHEANLQKIISHLQANSFITKQEVEQICRVADSTATKYLNELEKRGQVVQLGKSGPAVKYRLK